MECADGSAASSSSSQNLTFLGKYLRPARRALASVESCLQSREMPFDDFAASQSWLLTGPLIRCPRCCRRRRPDGRQCCRRARSDSTGTWLRRSSWLGCRAAACADSGKLLAGEQIISSSSPLAPTLHKPGAKRPHSVSVCGQTPQSKMKSLLPPYRLLCPVFISSPGSRWLSTSLSTQIWEKNIICGPPGLTSQSRTALKRADGPLSTSHCSLLSILTETLKP